MESCPKCGRERTGNARFCADCGTEFGGPQPIDVTRWDEPAEPTRWDPPAESARPDPPPGEPDPFASWFAPELPKDPASSSPTQTMPAQPGYGYQPPPRALVPTQSRSSGGKKAALFLIALLVVLGTGGGAYVLASRSGGHSATQPSVNSTRHAATAAATATPSGAASPSAPKSSNPGESRSAKPGRSASPGLVNVAPGVASNPAEPRVETVLTHYFRGINTHDYTMYASTLNARERANQPKSSFDSGYATTSDSGIKLTSITNTANGGLTATVTFTSHQAPANSVDKSACNRWTLDLHLVPSGAGYLIGQAPSGYHPAYSDC